MKRLLLLSIFALCLPAVLSAQERGLSVESAPVTDTAGTKYAILIGVNDYENIRSLSYAKNDTEALRDQLIAIGFEPSNIETLVCGGATRNLPTKRRIETVIGGVLNRAKEGDFVLLSMSGHGIEVEGQAQFCPMDTDPDDMTATTIPIKDIFAMLEQSKASLKLMIVDACRDNPFLTRSVRGVSVLPTVPNPPEGIWLLQSSSPGEQSWEDDEIKRGIFTHYLVEGLGGKAADKDGKVTFLGLSKYASEETNRRVFGKHRKNQRPYYRGEGRDFVLSAGDPHRELREKVMADYREFLEVWRKLSNRMTEAIYEEFLTNNAPDMLSDWKKALPSWKKAAEIDIPEGQFMYAMCLGGGIGISADIHEGVKWLRKAAEQGNAPAQRELGTRYTNGRGISKDEYEGHKWIRKAAEQGEAMAQSSLAYCYRYGWGVSKSEYEEAKWHRKAAEQGVEEAQYCLGFCYEYGRGVRQDKTEATKWYRKAAEQGNASAKRVLGLE